MTDLILQSVADGLVMGLIYALAALGLTLLYGIMHILNFAHGEIYMLGGYTSYLLISRFKMNFFLTLPIVIVVLFLFGVFLERAIFRRVIRGGFLNCLLATLGLSLILQAIGWNVFGTLDVTVPSPVTGVVHLGMITIPVQRLAAAAVGIITVMLLYLLVNKTKIGRHMKAIEQDSEAAALFGVNINSVNRMALGIGCALAAVAGALVGSIFYINPSIGGSVVLQAFLIIIIGGLGSITGCIIAALMIGVIQSVIGTLFGISMGYAVSFAILMVVLIVRPTGIAGHA